MSYINQPASITFRATKTELSPYTVLSQEGETVVVNNSEEPRLQLKVGDLLNFIEGIKGYVTEVSVGQAVVVTGYTGKLTTAVRAPLVPLRLDVVKVITEGNYGSMYVRCENTLTKTDGLLGWTLYGPNDTVIAIGSDYGNKDSCQLVGSGLWLPGLYRLRVTSFSDPSSRLLSVTKTWNLTRPISNLTVGEYSNSSLPLVLR